MRANKDILSKKVINCVILRLTEITKQCYQLYTSVSQCGRVKK